MLLRASDGWCDDHCMVMCLCIRAGDVPAPTSCPAAVLRAYLFSCCLLALILWLVLVLARWLWVY